MSQTQKTPGEIMLDQMVDAIPVLNDPALADMQAGAILGLTQDLAYNIFPPEDIAVRYGLGSIAGLRHFLLSHPEVVKKVAALRAIHNSEPNRIERNRIKANVLVEEILPSIGGMAMNTKATNSERLEAFKMLQRQAGVDGMPAADKNAVTGATFNLTMLFGGKEHKLTATVVDRATVPTIEGRVEEADERVEDV